ncbi:hypothetical protein D1164_17235 [Mariniphaga sediminis]|uniref:SbsA Ig-like domain-containing protein n=2 Tax=Mariniphaga sediminis TaxID=1628158 RepID=A0A399CXJ3_9BACT|nr:hypothetical protein [Mariniphaga sediminis]RIH63883.1 hypothetical protein D1164_17235 [Mariniphaga sediminis]
MKNIIIKITTVLFLGLLIMGCEKWDEYESADLASAPEATLSLVAVQDSAVTVSVNTNVAGYVSIVITDDTTLTAADIDGELLLIGNIDGLGDTLVGVESAQAVQHTFKTDLTQNMPYMVFAVASNGDGVYSAVKELKVQTDDSYAPYLVSTTPSKSPDAEQENSFSVELKFSEPVQLGEAPVFKFSYYFDDEEHVVDADTITVDGNLVTVYQSKVPHNGEWVFLSWEEGAVTDFLAGTPNKVEAQTSGVVEAELTGLYWRVQHVPFEMSVESFMPEAGSAVSDNQFDIMYKFPYAVSFATDDEGDPVYEDGDVTVVFWKEGKQVILEIPSGNLSITNDSTLVIALTEAASYGDWVSVSIAEGVVVDMYENPNAAFESDNESGANWLVSYGYTRDMIIGTYTIFGVSHPAFDFDESFEVTIEEDTENENQVIVTGMYYSDVPITAVFDGDFATLTFNFPLQDDGYNWIDIGDIYGDGDGSTNSLEVYGDDHFVCQIDADGNMSTGDEYWWGSYYYGVDADGWNNIFVASTWTKMESGVEASALKSGSLDKKKILHSGIPRIKMNEK